jgi:hypothetical protein
MLKFLGIVLVLVVAVFLVIAAMQPATFHVQRTVVINATPDKVAALINDFHQWPKWSPWANLDPNMKVTYSGAASGVGSAYDWEGNSKVGKGRMEITGISPMQTTLKLDFLKPFEGHNTAEFILEPQGTAATRVTWAMNGPNAFFPGKVMSVFGAMDKLVGKDFAAGLDNLKSVAEKQ